MKFDLNYYIILEDKNGNIHEIRSFYDKKNDLYNIGDTKNESLTVECIINKSNNPTANSCKLFIYNLSELNRNLIKKSRIDTNIYRKIEIYAGYEKQLSLIFKGNIQVANSYWEKDNWITEIEGLDGIYAIYNSNTEKSFSPMYETVNSSLLTDLQNYKINKGKITETVLKGNRGEEISGNTFNEILKRNNGKTIFIDNELLYILEQQEYLENNYLIIDSLSGLSPDIKEYDGYLELKMVFEPLANIQNIAEIKTDFNKFYNGQYIIIGITHNFKISKIGENTTANTILHLQYTFEDYQRNLTNIL